ncbi:hypothetical protein M501DRAFT_908812, partial [Patellaria atrata CBS 101060]
HELRPHSSSPHHGHNIDPAISGSGYPMSAGESPGEDHMGENRKGRRELSTSKRAAQNRAAQRAFRQRKEEYIKSLKDQVKGYEALSEHNKALENENSMLRDYIINLQSRLIESQGEYPQPPANIDLSQNRPTRIQQNAPTASMSNNAISELQQAAAQASHDGNKHSHEE